MSYHTKEVLLRLYLHLDKFDNRYGIFLKCYVEYCHKSSAEVTGRISPVSNYLPFKQFFPCMFDDHITFMCEAFDIYHHNSHFCHKKAHIQ